MPNHKELTLDEYLDLILTLASHDKDFYFRKNDWVKKKEEVKKWFDNFKGGVFGVGECPYCKKKYVLQYSDASVRHCVNPSCDYVLTPEYNPPAKSTITTTSKSRSFEKESFGNLHGLGKYSDDTTAKVIRIIFILIGIFAIVAPWYKYATSQSTIWLVVSILLSIIFLPITIIIGLSFKK